MSSSFMSSSFYADPVTRALGGADTSLEVGLLTASTSYLLLSRNRARMTL